MQNEESTPDASKKLNRKWIYCPLQNTLIKNTMQCSMKSNVCPTAGTKHPQAPHVLMIRTPALNLGCVLLRVPQTAAPTD